MTDQSTGDIPEKERSPSDIPVGAGDAFTSEVPSGMTLESIVDLTGEMEHLNELVMLHVEQSGGFTCTASYFTIVTPILDQLEGEIRFRYREGMSRDQVKLIVQDWIDKEIASIKHGA
ncbi:MAG: hypothetical protein PHT99_09890 [Methanoregula sp.]|nr:hypothetical protein [Methanoregula sp.]